jgi:hypothetical protein
MNRLRFSLVGSVCAIGVVFVMVTPAAAQDNHYACYQVKSKAPKVNGLSLDDEVTTQSADKCKLKLLCVAADKNGSGIPDESKKLLCWQCKGAKIAVPYTATDQFVSSLSITTKKLKLVCNPAAANSCDGTDPPCGTAGKIRSCQNAGYTGCDNVGGKCKCT